MLISCSQVSSKECCNIFKNQNKTNEFVYLCIDYGLCRMQMVVIASELLLSSVVRVGWMCLVVLSSDLAPGGRGWLDVVVRPALTVSGVWCPASATIWVTWRQGVPDFDPFPSETQFKHPAPLHKWEQSKCLTDGASCVRTRMFIQTLYLLNAG